MVQEKGNAQSGERKINEPDGWIAYCDKCGKAFDSNDAIRVPYQEYLGAAFSCEEVSPCCGVGYNDVPKDGVNEEDEIARTEEAHERTVWRQRLRDLEGE